MFTAVRSHKVSEHIVEQIRNAILEGSLKPGDKLPPERELAAAFEVSKATLREALRSLETMGFLEIRKGVLGGAFVVEMDMKKARECLSNFLHFQSLRLKDLTEVRLLLESYTSETAAGGITQNDLKRLKELIDRSEEVLPFGTNQEYREMEIEFHKIIGSVTENPILMLLLDFIENLLIDTKEILQPDMEFSKRVLAAHKRIYQTLIEGDPKKAREAMIDHVSEVAKDLTVLQNEKFPHIEEIEIGAILRGKFQKGGGE